MRRPAIDVFTESLRDAGKNVVAHGEAYSAQCPAHDDTNPSLSIARRNDNKGIVVHCHAGCPLTDILAALGLKPADLFDDETIRSVYQPSVDYRYPGGRINRRRPGKKFSQTRSEDHSLYAADRLTDDHRRVVLCEGEKGAELLWSLNHPAVATGGAQRSCDMTPLTGRKILLIVDRDPAGDEWATNQLAALTGVAESTRCAQAAVDYPHADIADHIEAGHKLAELVPYTPPQTLLAQRRFNGGWLSAQHFDPLCYPIPGLIPEGFGVLAAPPKAGKSWLVLNLAIAAASAGKALSAIQVPQRRPVLYMALEDGQRRLQERARIITAGQPIPDILEFIILAENPGIAFGMINDFLTEQRGNAPLIIVDTFGRIKPARPNGADAYQHDYSVAGQLKALIDTETGGSLLVVHHTRKAEANDYVAEISGTFGLTAAADYLLVLSRKRDSYDAILSVTGRDVKEGRYALSTDNAGIWRLAGDDLNEAQNEAQTRTMTSALGERALEVLAFVNNRAETTAADVIEQLGISKDQARTYLLRLADSGRIARTQRGRYTPVNICVSSVSSVANDETLATVATCPPGGAYSSNATDATHATEYANFAEPRHQADPSKWKKHCSRCGEPLTAPTSITRGHCEECHLTQGDQ